MATLFRAAPGTVRDAVISTLRAAGGPLSLDSIPTAGRVGNVPASSVRSYLNLNTPRVFKRIGMGVYCLPDLETAHSASYTGELAVDHARSGAPSRPWCRRSSAGAATSVRPCDTSIA